MALAEGGQPISSGAYGIVNEQGYTCYGNRSWRRSPGRPFSLQTLTETTGVIAIDFEPGTNQQTDVSALKAP